jgi:hypothetical protein
LSNFKITDDEDLFAVHVPIKDDYMDAWWGKFVDSEHHRKIAHEDDEEYYDSEVLVSLDGTSGEGIGQRKRRYREFNEKHDMRRLIVLDKGDMFTYTSIFKKALKWYDVQNVFDFKYKHNDSMRVTAVCKEQDCTWRIHASLDANK